MSISYPLELPLGRNFRSAKIGVTNYASRNTSPFSQKEQIYMHQGDRWLVDISFPALKVEDAKNMIGFFASLHGPLGTFYVRDPFAGDPLGVATGTPLVKGAGQTGYEVLTDGWTTTVTGQLKRGDFISIGSGYHVITKDANSDGSGESTLDIWPSLRGTVADNAAVVTQNAKLTCRLVTNGFTYNINTDGTYDIAVSAIEAT